MTFADSHQQERLERILDITRLMAATNDLGRLLRVIIDRSTELLDAERASLFVYEAEPDELVSYVATGVEEIRFPADRGIAGATIQGGRTIHVPDAYADPRFNREIDRQTGFRTREIVSVPLRDHDGQLVAVLQVLNKRGGAFRDADIALAETLAAQAGVALQRARLMEHYVREQEMRRAMAIAREIQQNLLPSEPPQVDGFDVAGASQPADDTGGDTFDFLALPDGRWMLVVADASGHGVGPALVIAETRAMLRAVCLQGADLPNLMGTVNTLLERDLAGGRFVTCFVGVLDAPAADLAYISAGHGPMLFYDRARDQFAEASAVQIPMGIMPELDFSDVAAHHFAPGDLAVICTDGIFEATDVQGEDFGVERTIEILRRDRDLPATRIVENLQQAVKAFTAGRPQSDDITVVAIRRN
jgi:phosphoserine phosphatase